MFIRLLVILFIIGGLAVIPILRKRPHLLNIVFLVVLGLQFGSGHNKLNVFSIRCFSSHYVRVTLPFESTCKIHSNPTLKAHLDFFDFFPVVWIFSCFSNFTVCAMVHLSLSLFFVDVYKMNMKLTNFYMK